MTTHFHGVLPVKGHDLLAVVALLQSAVNEHSRHHHGALLKAETLHLEEIDGLGLCVTVRAAAPFTPLAEEPAEQLAQRIKTHLAVESFAQVEQALAAARSAVPMPGPAR